MTPDKAPVRPVEAPTGVPGTSGHLDPATAQYDRRARWWQVMTRGTLEQALALADAELADLKAEADRYAASWNEAEDDLTAARAEVADLKTENLALNAACGKAFLRLRQADAEAERLLVERTKARAEVAELRAQAGEQRILGAVMATDDQATERDALRREVERLTASFAAEARIAAHHLADKLDLQATLARVKGLAESWRSEAKGSVGDLAVRTRRHAYALFAALDAPTEPAPTVEVPLLVTDPDDGSGLWLGHPTGSGHDPPRRATEATT